MKLTKDKKKLIFIISAAVAAVVLIASAVTAGILLSRPAEKVFKITFVSGGGSPVDPVYTPGNRDISLPVPVREGYAFEGWFFDNGTFQEQLLRDTYRNKPLDRDITVYAKWTFTGYTVTFNLGEGETVSAVVGRGGRVAPPAEPTRQGYVFWGWYIDAGLSVPYDFSQEVSSDFTLYAKWMLAEGRRIFTVTFDGMGMVTLPPADIEEGEQAALPAPSAEGYDFMGWYIDQALTIAYPPANQVAANITLYAKWRENPAVFTVSFETNGGSEVAPISVKINAIIEPPATGRDGYELAGWYKDEQFIYLFDFGTRITAETVLYAKWNKLPDPIVRYTVTFKDYYANGDRMETSVLKGTQVPVHTPPSRAGYTFGGWFKENGEAYDFSLPLSGDLELFPLWEPSGEYRDGSTVYSLSQDRSYYIVTAYNADSGDVQILSEVAGLPVKRIADGVFKNKHTESVTLPEGLERIGGEAFRGGGFTEIVIPASVTHIGANAFADNGSLLSVEIKGAPQIGAYAFARNSKLNRVILPNGIQTLSENMLSGAVNLATFTFPDAVTAVPRGFLEGAIRLYEVTLSSNIKEIGDNAFKNCGTLSSIDLAGVETIGNQAFYNTGLTSVVLPNGIISVGNQAFGSCPGLKTVNIGKGLVSIGNGFFGCPIENYIVAPDNPNLASAADGSLYSKDYKTLIRIAPYSEGAEIEEFAVPHGIERIASGAFAGASGLKKITLSDTVREIDSGAIIYTASLMEIEANGEYFTSEDGVLFNKDKTALIKYPMNKVSANYILPRGVTEIAEGAFAEAGIERIDLGTAVEKIGARAFAGSALTRITLPQSVTYIGQEAFSDCVSLTAATFTASTDTLPGGLFRGAVALEDVYFYSSPAASGNAFSECVSIKTVSVYDAAGIINFSTFAVKPILKVKGQALFNQYESYYAGKGIFSDIILIP